MSIEYERNIHEVDTLLLITSPAKKSKTIGTLSEAPLLEIRAGKDGEPGIR